MIKTTHLIVLAKPNVCFVAAKPHVCLCRFL